MSIKLDKAARDEVITAIRMRMNIIETGDPSLGAVDIAARNEKARSSLLRSSKLLAVKPLSREQRDILNVLEDAAKELAKD